MRHIYSFPRKIKKITQDNRTINVVPAIFNCPHDQNIIIFNTLQKSTLMGRAQTRSEHDERRNCTIGRSPRVRLREKGAAGVACSVRETWRGYGSSQC